MVIIHQNHIMNDLDLTAVPNGTMKNVEEIAGVQMSHDQNPISIIANNQVDEAEMQATPNNVPKETLSALIGKVIHQLKITAQDDDKSPKTITIMRVNSLNLNETLFG